ncbi:MAG: hypothetical protein FWG61_03270 [Firmicutes bacterium]|nr:hypothetical protein [Bacillota bacterium]
MRQMHFAKSIYLFSTPSFIFGAARVLDIGGTFDTYTESESASVADQRALLSDWQQVGLDIAQGMEMLEDV